MSRRSDLEAASAKQRAAIKKLTPPKTLKQAQALITNYGSLVKQLEELATLPPDAPTGTTAPPPVTPPTSGDAAAKRRAWTTIEAEDQINGVWERAGLGPNATAATRIAALGPLAGKAIALTQFGFPGETPGVDYSLADQFGGVWGIQRHGSSGAFLVSVWTGGTEPSHVAGPFGMPPLDWAEIGRAHGLNDNLDGPA